MTRGVVYAVAASESGWYGSRMLVHRVCAATILSLGPLLISCSVSAKPPDEVTQQHGDRSAGDTLTWIVDLVNRGGGLTTTEVNEWFSEPFIEDVGGIEAVKNTASQLAAALKPVSVAKVRVAGLGLAADLSTSSGTMAARSRASCIYHGCSDATTTVGSWSSSA